MSYEYEHTTVSINPRIFIKILYGGIVMICALVSYCCCRRKQNTEIVISRAVANSSYSNAALVRAIPLPPPTTNNYQGPRTHPPQPASNAPSASDASDLPPSYDQFYAKQPPYNHTAH